MTLDRSKCNEVPEWLRPSLKEAFKTLPESWISNISQHLPGGFRKKAQILEQIRVRLLDYALVPKDWASEIRRVLPYSKLIQILSPEGIEPALSTLVALGGVEPIALTLWMDSRQEVVVLAEKVRLLTPSSIVALAEAQKHWNHLIELHFFAPFGILPLTSTLLPQSLKSASVISLPSLAVTQAAKEKEESEAVHLQKRVKELQRKFTAAEVEQGKVLSVKEEEIVNLKGRLAESMEARRLLEWDFHQKIRDEVAKSLTAQARPWLARAIAVEESTTEASLSDNTLKRLLTDAERALDRQFQSDRHCGNNAQIRGEIHQLEEIRSRMQTTVEESLNPLSDWPRLRERLDAGIRERRQVLREVPSGKPWAKDLAVEIALARSGEELNAMTERMTAMVATRLLDEEGRAWLLQRAIERRSALQDPLRPTVAPVLVKLSAVLQGKSAGFILVDTYNWIGKAFAELGVSGDSASFPQTFQSLRPLLEQLGRQATLARIRFVTDSPRSDRDLVLGTVEIEWSGGTGEHRADTVIGEHLRYWKSEAVRVPLWVVSADRAVCRDARANGATVEDPVDFSRRLSHTLNSLKVRSNK